VIVNIRDGLKDILSSKLGSEQRDKALSLVMFLLDHLGGRWLFSPNIDEGFSYKKSSEYSKEKADDFKFAALVIQLACIEIKLMLDELMNQRENIEEKGIKDNNNNNSNNNKADIGNNNNKHNNNKDNNFYNTTTNSTTNNRHEIMLPVCYTILEKSIEYFSQFENFLDSQDENAEVSASFDPEILLKIKGTLTETFRVIIDNLLEFKVRKVFSLIEKKSLKKKNPNSATYLIILIYW